MKIATDLAEVQVLTEHFFSLFNKDLTNNEYKTLLFLRIYGLASPKILIRKIGILKTNLAYTLKMLIEKDFVEVCKHPTDARGKQYCLTPKGEEKLGEVLLGVKNSLDYENIVELDNALKTIIKILNKKL